MNKAYLSRFIGYATGSELISNEDLNSDFPEWSANQILDKIGVRKRHHISKGEDAIDLAKRAGADFFSKSEVDKRSIDYVILVTSSPRFVTPSSSVLLQDELGLRTNIGAIDINQGCSGFVYGLSVAKGLVSSGQVNNVLLITAETYSKYIDKQDKSNLTIFGDAATCSLISSDGDRENFREIGNFHFGSNGAGFDKIIVNDGVFKMDGKAVFEFTAKTIVSELREFVDLPNYKGDFVLHQANTFMLGYMRKKLKINKSNFIIEMSEYGNTVSSSIPLALNSTSKTEVILAGFGVGLSWAFVNLF